MFTAEREAEAFFAGSSVGLAAYQAVHAAVEGLGPVTVRTTKSQVTFARRRGFAYLWIPGRWLRRPAAEVVLSIALPRHDPSSRFKAVAHPSRTVWMHHLELTGPADIDTEVIGWLREGYEGAA